MAPVMSRNRRINQRGKNSPEKPAKSPHRDLIYGFHPVVAALANPARRKHRLLLTHDARSSLKKYAGEKHAGEQALSELESGAVESHLVARPEIDAALPPGAVHQGLLLKCEPLPARALDEVCAPGADSAPVLLLDQVSDPHNVGAILRSAAAFGVHAVILQDRHSPAITGALAKAASGALEIVPLVRVTNLSRAMGQLKDMGYWLIGLDDAAEARLDGQSFKQPVALVLGAEGSGLRRLTRETCDSLAAIRLTDSMHSLNVSNAAAVALYQLTLDTR
jgi:23S rRNA (guanosine2251-2'-O)-methyltransferase